MAIRVVQPLEVALDIDRCTGVLDRPDTVAAGVVDPDRMLIIQKVEASRCVTDSMELSGSGRPDVGLEERHLTGGGDHEELPIGREVDVLEIRYAARTGGGARLGK